MSDDEDGAPREKRQRIYFGSLEESERERLSKANAPNADKSEEGQKKRENGVSESILAGIKAGNINISEGTYILSCVGFEFCFVYFINFASFETCLEAAKETAISFFEKKAQETLTGWILTPMLRNVYRSLPLFT